MLEWIKPVALMLAQVAETPPPEPEAAAHAGAELLAQTPPPAFDPGILHFFTQSDLVGQTLFVILLLMSLVTWYLIVAKAVLQWRQRRGARRFLHRFWTGQSREQLERVAFGRRGQHPFAHLARAALLAVRECAPGGGGLGESGPQASFVTRMMRKVIDEETTRLESGLTTLASIGSTAPFVGLFGTVWGVYHALLSISMSEGVTINRIAGPVGEALIMTGLGLAVAIPAVLAYNACVRANRVYLARLDAFAHDLFTFLSTGHAMGAPVAGHVPGAEAGLAAEAEPAVAGTGGAASGGHAAGRHVGLAAAAREV